MAASVCYTVASDPMQQVNIIYYDDFSCSKINCHIPVSGCHQVLVFDHILKKETAILHCVAHISFLREKSIIQQWIYTERLKGYFPFTVKEFGINNVRAHIAGVKTLECNNKNHDIRKESVGRRGVITGLFARKSMNVRSYDFQSLQTGKISTVHVTTNHRFYVKNRNSFIPIADISCQDKLLDVRGNEARLVCSDKLFSHHNEKRSTDGESIISVYNLEVSGKHVYFAGKDSLLLVHNTYYDKCPLCGHKPYNNTEYEAHMIQVHHEVKPYICTTKYCSRKYGRLHNLKLHIASEHSESDSVRCVYFDCKLKFANLSELNVHIKGWHTSDITVIDPRKIESRYVSDPVFKPVSEPVPKYETEPKYDPMLTSEPRLKLAPLSLFPSKDVTEISDRHIKPYYYSRFFPYKKPDK